MAQADKLRHLACLPRVHSFNRESAKGWRLYEMVGGRLKTFFLKMCPNLRDFISRKLLDGLSLECQLTGCIESPNAHRDSTAPSEITVPDCDTLLPVRRSQCQCDHNKRRCERP